MKRKGELKDEKFKTELNDLGRMNRRTFVKMAGVAAGAVALGGSMLKFIPSASAVPLPGGTLDPLTIPKYVTPLTRPPAMPQSTNTDPTFTGHYYEIAMRQFTQQILPAGMPATTVWSYGSANDPTSFNYPAFTIEALYNIPVRVKWINDLKDPLTGNFQPHILPVDQTLHWANPPGPIDSRPTFTATPGPYTGPVPMVPHLHGGHNNEESDGYPEAWFLPAANNLTGFTTEGSKYLQFKAKFEAAHPNALWAPGTAVFEYDNFQRASTLWFHDHSLGMTRNNVYAGPAGFYLIRGGPDDLPSGVPGGLPGGAYEIPIVIQDRSFNTDGSLFYPASRFFFDGYAGPYAGDPASDIAPIWNPEFFGNTMVVNGKTWPFLEVEPRKYRFRFLNGSDSRFLILKFSDGNVKVNFTQIGSEGGFLPAPVVLGQLLIGPAERADVVVDFSTLNAGDVIHLLNVGPDVPFGGPFPNNVLADPNTTGQVMQLRVVKKIVPGRDPSAIPPLPAFTAVGAATSFRNVSLNELESTKVCVDRSNVFVPGATPPLCTRRSAPLAPLEAQLGTIDPITGLPVPLKWMDGITENPAVGVIEEWDIHNFTADAHPIHIHEIMFQVVNRQVIGGAVRGPETWETGLKDTVVAYPGEITRVKALYDRAGLFVWHCHILSHEDNEMMRPYRIGP